MPQPLIQELTPTRPAHLLGYFLLATMLGLFGWLAFQHWGSNTLTAKGFLASGQAGYYPNNSFFYIEANRPDTAAEYQHANHFKRTREQALASLPYHHQTLQRLEKQLKPLQMVLGNLNPGNPLLQWGEQGLDIQQFVLKQQRLLLPFLSAQGEMQYPQWFEPGWSLGSWPSTEKPSAAYHTLAIFDLKQKAPSLKTVLQQLNLNYKDFKPCSQLKKFDCRVSQKLKGALLLHNKRLWIASDEQVLQKLEQRQFTPLKQSVAEHALFQKHQHLLPNNRQGSLLLTPAQILKQVTPSTDATKMFSTLPESVGSIQYRAQNHHGITDVMLLSTLPEALGQRLQPAETRFVSTQFIHEEAPGLFVALSGLDRLWDYYESQALNPAQQIQLKAYQLALLSFQVDLRKDLIGFLEGETSLWVRPGQKRNPLLFTSNTLNKTNAFNRLSKFFSLSLLPFKLHQEQVGLFNLQTLGLKQPFTLLPQANGLSVSITPLNQNLFLMGLTGDVVSALRKNTLLLTEDAFPNQQAFQQLSNTFPEKSLALWYSDLRHSSTGSVLTPIPANAVAGSLSLATPQTLRLDLSFQH